MKFHEVRSIIRIIHSNYSLINQKAQKSNENCRTIPGVLLFMLEILDKVRMLEILFFGNFKTFQKLLGLNFAFGKNLRSF